MYKIYIRNKNDILLNDNIISKYNDIQMKEMSNKAWSYLFQILKQDFNIEVNQNDIIYNEYNKPYIKDNPIYFNISHSKDIIAIIISDCECGIDIEYIDYQKDVEKLALKIMNNTEIKHFNKVINKHKYFYKIWTKKETYFKIKGTGIDFKDLTEYINLKNIKSYIYINKKDKYYISFCNTK